MPQSNWRTQSAVVKLAQMLRFGREPRTILITEPDAILRRAECGALSPAYQIVEASSAVEAVRICAQHKAGFDLLLTEVRLPRMDGWDLAELVKLDYPNLKIVYLSSTIDSEIRAHTRPSMIFLMEKNRFRPTLLRQAVHDVLEP
jgi:two-component system, cell cycle response regulator CpdR